MELSSTAQGLSRMFAASLLRVARVLISDLYGRNHRCAAKAYMTFGKCPRRYQAARVRGRSCRTRQYPLVHPLLLLVLRLRTFGTTRIHHPRVMPRARRCRRDRAGARLLV